jgi:uncharacterized membrane protein YfcA
MDLILNEITSFALVVSILVTLAAGFVKGAVGFAMPLIMISGLSSVLDPKLALAGIIIPVVVSNLVQTFRTGLAPAVEAVREFWRYLLVVCIAIFLTAQIVTLIPSRVFYAVLGVPVVVLCLIQLAGVRPKIAAESRVWAEWLVGLISGVLGGLAGTWGPTTVLYLIAIGTPKARQIVVQGVIYGVGAFTLLAAHLRSGILNVETAPFSALLLIPAYIGLALGFRMHDRMNPETFRKVTLIVLTIAGLNLIRRAVMG